MTPQERVILHCDLNNYFASVECLSHPEWRAVPMAVCGSVEERHGIVLAKNELAKKAGVKTAMTVPEALRLCPRLVLAPPHYDQYVAYSHRVRQVYAKYTDQIEPFGIDECWLDVTGSQRLFGSGEQIAHRLRQEVKQAFGLTISVGVSFCKVLAKLGSDMKKPDAVTLLARKDLPTRVWPLPAADLMGVGRHTAPKLAQLGIYTVGQLAAASSAMLQRRLGKQGLLLWRNANGFDTDPVRYVGDFDPAKSVSRTTTCRADLETPAQVRQVLVGLAESVCTALRREQAYAEVVKIYLRDRELAWCQRQAVLPVPTRLVGGLVNPAMELLAQSWRGVPLRSVGIGAGRLVSERVGLQAGLFYDLARLERTERLESRVDEVRRKMGKNALVRASQMLTPLQVTLGSGFGRQYD